MPVCLGSALLARRPRGTHRTARGPARNRRRRLGGLRAPAVTGVTLLLGAVGTILTGVLAHPSVWLSAAGAVLLLAAFVVPGPVASTYRILAASPPTERRRSGRPLRRTAVRTLLTRGEYAWSAAGSIDMMLTLVYALLALAVPIALLGIAKTLTLAVHERTRELGLLRAVGQTRSQLRTMVRWESVLVAAFGTAGGLLLGGFLGWVLVKASEGAGDTPFAFALPPTRLLVVALVGITAGALAGWRPARRAARLHVLLTASGACLSDQALTDHGGPGVGVCHGLQGRRGGHVAERAVGRCPVQ